MSASPFIVSNIHLEDLPAGKISKLKLNLTTNALGEYWQVPVMIARGMEEGPVLGITAAIHGNELNGIPVIHKLFESLDMKNLKGTVIAVPILNIPGYLQNTREFIDGIDINRIMPGKPDGNSAHIYAHEVVEKLLKKFDYLIDLHTASFGRINSLYIRADLTHSVIADMAKLQEPDIIVNHPGGDGTLRKAASDMGKPSITIEIGDSHIFQKKHIRPSFFGIKNVMEYLKMIPESGEHIEESPYICRKSYWIYADCGGLLEVYPQLVSKIEKGDRIAVIRDAYGDILKEYYANREAVVVAKSTNPVCQAGSRVIHLGIEWEDHPL